MKKKSPGFVCSSCGRIESKWLGRCPACGEWNTMNEEIAVPENQADREHRAKKHHNLNP